MQQGAAPDFTDTWQKFTSHHEVSVLNRNPHQRLYRVTFLSKVTTDKCFTLSFFYYYSQTYSFQCDRFLLILCCVTDWMRRESGVKGLKLTRGVWCLLLLSVIDFPEASAFLKRETLLLEDPALPLARDSRLCKGFTASLKCPTNTKNKRKTLLNLPIGELWNDVKCLHFQREILLRNDRHTKTRSFRQLWKPWELCNRLT